jgi:hypothetical protein
VRINVEKNSNSYWLRLSLLCAGLSVGVMGYFFAINLVSRFLPQRVAMFLPTVVIWSIVFWFVYRRRNTEEDASTYVARLVAIPLVAVLIVTVIAFSLAMIVGGLWVQLTYSGP